MENKLLTGRPLPPPEILDRWLREKLKGLNEVETEELTTTIREVFLVDSMAADSGLTRVTRSRLYKLFDLGVVRTKTVETRRKDGVEWSYFHWELKFSPASIPEQAPVLVPLTPPGSRQMASRVRGPRATLPSTLRGGSR